MEKNSIFVEKLRSSGLRPTKQRIKICKLLFDRKKTFHFTINDIFKMLQNETSKEISLATIYNTVHSFKKKGYLKEISVNKDKIYFDTNMSSHHHFYNKENEILVDVSNNLKINGLPNPPKGKRIEKIEVLVHLKK